MSANDEHQSSGTSETPPPADVVRPFVDPAAEYRAMAKIHQGEAIVWGIFLNRHARRVGRNAHRVRIANDVALLTRSEEAFGSMQAAEVAKRVSAAADSLLEKLMPSPQKDQANVKGGEDE